MAANEFTAVDGTTPTGVTLLANTLLAANPGTGIAGFQLTGLSYIGAAGSTSIFESLVLRTGGTNSISFGGGILITSGDGTPNRTNTGGAVGTNLSRPGDTEMTNFAKAAFPSAGNTQDATILTLTINVSDPNLNSIRFDVAFGSDEYPEYSNTSFVDIASISRNGVNYALINNNTATPLSVVNSNLTLGNFIDNRDSAARVEYDGLINKQSIFVPVTLGVNTIRIGVADTGDGIYDSGLFILDMTGSGVAQGGTFQDVPGTPGNDLLYGGANNDSATGGDGADVLVLFGGDDVGTGDSNNDYVYAGDGNDTAYGNGGIDVLLGEAGNDVLDGGDDQDYLFGGDGNDTLSGGAGVDVFIAGAGNDTMNGGAEGDYFYGEGGDDIGNGDDGNDIFVMGDGNDTANGGAGQDYFYMGAGNDVLNGGDGVDVMLGEAGNDTFDPGAGVDYLFLGPGGTGDNDTVIVRPTTGVVVVNNFEAGGTNDVVRLVGTAFTEFGQVQNFITDYSAAGGFSVLTLDADTSVWFIGVTPAALTSADFLFA